jgi:hypothetical protein
MNRSRVLFMARLALCVVFIVLCGLTFLKYVGWASFYSGISGLSARAADAHVASQKARLFFWIFICSQALAVLMIGSAIKFTAVSSRALAYAARYSVALVISLISTGLVVSILSHLDR